MRIALDLDDVLADLIAKLIDLHHAINGVALERRHAVGWDVFPAAVHDAARSRGYASLEPRPGAAAFLRWITREHSVYIVTYRTAEAEAVTLDWLDSHFPGLEPRVHFTGGPKVKTCCRLQVELMIDDSTHHLAGVTQALRIPGILISSPMNRHVQDTRRIRRANDLREARTLVEQVEANGGQFPPIP